jgi:hypothetical protein
MPFDHRTAALFNQRALLLAYPSLFYRFKGNDRPDILALCL